MGKEKPLHIVKIGGNVINVPGKLKVFLEDFAKIKAPKILVHGGGKVATDWADRLEIPQHQIDGRRVTDEATLELITMIYGGLISKNIVATLSACGLDALGLSGADASSITSGKRPKDPMDYGFVGDVKYVNHNNISKLLESGFVPIFCAITHDGKGQLLNTNADTMAAVIAAAMTKTYTCHLYYCFEKKGVLRDICQNDSVIPEISAEIYLQMLKENKISEGMMPKLDNAFNAVKEGVEEVYVLQADDLSSLIITQEHHGTKITR